MENTVLTERKIDWMISVRHGERVDDPEREILKPSIDNVESAIKFDCHLTAKGLD